jgi:hypothetical protein
LTFDKFAIIDINRAGRIVEGFVAGERCLTMEARRQRRARSVHVIDIAFLRLLSLTGIDTHGAAASKCRMRSNTIHFSVQRAPVSKLSCFVPGISIKMTDMMRIVRWKLIGRTAAIWRIP